MRSLYMLRPICEIALIHILKYSNGSLTVNIYNIKCEYSMVGHSARKGLPEMLQTSHKGQSADSVIGIMHSWSFRSRNGVTCISGINIVKSFPPSDVSGGIGAVSLAG